MIDPSPNTGGVHVLLAFQPEVGGVPRYVANLADGLAARGWQLTIAAPTRTPVRSQLEAVSHGFVPIDVGSSPTPADMPLAVRLARLCRRERIDLIHAHSSKAGALAVAAGTFTATPSIYSPHAWSFQRELSPRAEQAYVRLERTLMRRHRHAIAVAEVERTEAIHRDVVAPERIELIETGLPDAASVDAATARERLGLDPSRFTLGWVGRDGSQKRSEDLLGLVDRMGTAIQLVVLGNGMAESVNGRALRERGAVVLSTGRAADVYGASDVLVLTSRWEASPVVVVEAMRAGLPVVAYDVGGVSAQVRDGETGFLVPSGDVAALSTRVERLVNDRMLRRSMGRDARTRYEQVYGFDRMMDRICTRYTAVLEHHGAQL
jgi:glycosyltransferase involved in cell wall biosynthesis